MRENYTRESGTELSEAKKLVSTDLSLGAVQDPYWFWTGSGLLNPPFCQDMGWHIQLELRLPANPTCPLANSNQEKTQMEKKT